MSGLFMRQRRVVCVESSLCTVDWGLKNCYLKKENASNWESDVMCITLV
jgi:hypothetical protein